MGRGNGRDLPWRERSFGIAERALVYVGPVIQATGLLVALASLATNAPTAADRTTTSDARTPERVRPRVSISPTVASGVGLSFAVTQW